MIKPTKGSYIKLSYSDTPLGLGKDVAHKLFLEIPINLRCQSQSLLKIF